MALTPEELETIGKCAEKLSAACAENREVVLQVRDVMKNAASSNEKVALSVMQYCAIVMRLAGVTEMQALSYVSHALSRAYGQDVDGDPVAPVPNAKKPDLSN